MIIYPALELADGRPQRPAKSRFDVLANYLLDPVEAVLDFEEAGAEWAHLVDLDGAEEGRPCQHGLIVDIALSVSLKLQVAGGFRERSHLRRMFDAGVDRVVLGELAVRNPILTHELFAEFGDRRIALALDDPTRIEEFTRLYPEARHMIVDCGDIPPATLALLRATLTRVPHISVQVSGNFASLEGLSLLKDSRAAGAIVGQALWEQRFELSEALDLARA